MPGTMDRSRDRVRSRLRLLGCALIAPCLTGCTAMTQDVHAYYHQMAINWQEALDKAKHDETTLQNQSRVLGVTGDQSGYLKTQRKLEKLRSWEARCAKEQKRFEKAAEWMESHFDIKKSKFVSEAYVPDSAPDGPSGGVKLPNDAVPVNPEEPKDHDIP